MKRAWYLHLTEAQTPDNAILVGDRSRVWTITNFLDSFEVLNEDRGLLTVRGQYKEMEILVVAFGMGSPIAAVVAHELVNLGVKRILRLGTMMRVGVSRLGDFVIAEDARGEDGTSKSYISDRDLYHANSPLLTTSKESFKSFDIKPKVGRAMSVDGFYTSMMSLDKDSEAFVKERHKVYETDSCLGIDMETAALYALGEKMNIEVCSICLVTVDGISKNKMNEFDRKVNEEILCQIGLISLSRREEDASIK